MKTFFHSILLIAILLSLGLVRGTCIYAQWTEPVLLPPPINVDPMGEYYYSTISADGCVLCITICIGGPPGTGGGYGDDDVWISEKQSDGMWTRPVNAGPNVNNAGRNLSPSITNDRQWLYYVSWTGSTYKMFVSQRTGPKWDDWSPGTQLPSPVNRGRVFTGQILWDDSTLSFTDTGQPGILHGGDAMYTSRLQPDGSWSEPHLLGFHLNRLNDSYHPCLTDSGRTLVYGQYGGPHREDDIFYAFRNDTGFGGAQRCDSTVNGSFWDSDPSCPANGSLLYFESRRPIGQDTTWGAHLYVAHRVRLSVPNRPAPSTFALAQNYPNPFNPVTQIPFAISRTENIALQIFNVNGQLVRTLVNKRLTPGEYNLSFDGGNLPSGMYLYRLASPSFTQTRKMVLLK